MLLVKNIFINKLTMATSLRSEKSKVSQIQKERLVKTETNRITLLIFKI